MARQLPIADAIDRHRRLAAAGFDIAGLFAATLAAVAVASLWLLLRTGLGRNDAGDGDAVLALALVAAVVPAWTVYMAASLWRNAATPGQRRMGVTVGAAAGPAELPQWRRGLRLALHPLALPAWTWLTLTALLTGAPWLWLPIAVAATAVAFASVASLVLLVVRPSMPAVHDRLARTALTPLPRQASSS